ncbi:MAG: hypothetical protein ACOX3V_01345 [Bacillota bacterium]
MKTLLPLTVTFTGGMIVLLDYFIDLEPVSLASGQLLSWSVLIAAFATTLGSANLLQIHAANIKGKRPNWGLSLVLVVSLLAWFVVGLIGTQDLSIYKFVWQHVYSPLSSTMFALNAFFIASAAYRSFRVKGHDSALLLICAVIVMLGRVGIGEAISPRLPDIADWIMEIPGTAGMRGITIGGALGAITASLRIILGLDRAGTGIFT